MAPCDPRSRSAAICSAASRSGTRTGSRAISPRCPTARGACRIGNARQIEVEDRAADATAEAGTISVQKDVFWSKDLLFFEAKGAGSKVTVPFDVAEDGRYEIVAQLAHSPDYGAYTVELDGQATANATALEHEPGANVGDAGRIDAYFTETYVAEDHLIGWAQLARGRHTLTFVCAGRNAAASAYNLGIDTIILAKLGDRHRHLWHRTSALCIRRQRHWYVRLESAAPPRPPKPPRC